MFFMCGIDSTAVPLKIHERAVLSDIKSVDICVGRVSSGNKHTLVKETAERIRRIL
ncbi:MAG: hypothetical protein IJ062_06410 [Firmicutes bacterium]|nr:hypothetical protein [Bacillota bacterium]